MLPRFVYLELSVRCNLRCYFCDNSIRNRYADLPWEQAQSLLGQLTPGTYLGLHGLGEPTLYPRLLDILRMAKERGCFVYFNSNHTVTSEEQMRGFVELGLDELRISMSAAHAKRFAEYSGRDLFPDLLERIRRIVELRKGKAKPLLRIVFVLTPENAEEFAEVVGLAEKLGVDEVQLQTTLDWGRGGGGLTEIFEPERLLFLRETLARAQQGAQRVRLLLPHFLCRESELTQLPSGGKCQWLEDAVWITANGSFTPCCNLHDPSVWKLGQYSGQALSEIRESPAYQQFRADYRAQKIASCLSCPVNYGLFKNYTYPTEITG